MVKYVGYDPFPASLITIVSIIFGWGLCAWLCTPYAAQLIKNDDANALPGTLGVRRTPLPPILLPAITAIGLLLGSVLFFTAKSIVGVIILGLVFPSLVSAATLGLGCAAATLTVDRCCQQHMLTWFESVHMARSLAISRAYLWGGLLVFLHVFCWVGVLTWENTPVFGAIFGGRSDMCAPTIFPLRACAQALPRVSLADEKDASAAGATSSCCR